MLVHRHVPAVPVLAVDGLHHREDVVGAAMAALLGAAPPRQRAAVRQAVAPEEGGGVPVGAEEPGGRGLRGVGGQPNAGEREQDFVQSLSSALWLWIALGSDPESQQLYCCSQQQ